MKTILLIIFTIFIAINISFSQSGWYVAASGIGSNLISIFFIDSQTGWICENSGNGNIYKSTDGGTSWVLVSSNPYMFSRSICFIDTTNGVVAAGDYPIGMALYPIWFTENGGGYWRNVAYNNYYGAGFHSVALVNGAYWYCGTLTPFGIPNVTHSFIGPQGGEINLGHSIPLNRIRAGINVSWTVGNNGLVYRSTILCGVGNDTANLTGVSFQDANTGYVVGGRFMYKSTNNGGSWNGIYPLAPAGTYNDVWFLNKDTGWVACVLSDGVTGAMLYTSNGGVNWVQQYSGLNGSEIRFINNQTGWVLCGSSVLKTTTGGVSGIPNIPIPLSPPNGSSALPLADTLTWNVISGATSYRLQVSTDSNFTTLFLNDSTISGNLRYVTGLSPLTYYWWRVNAKNALGTSGFSTPFSFKTMGVPGIPTAIVPANNAINQPVSLTFQWSRTFDQTLAVAAKYWFELYSDTTIAAIVKDSTLTDTTSAVSGLLNNHNYWWKVKAMNVVGWGLFSSYSKFTTIPAVPPPPSLVSPANNSVDNPVSLSLVWNKSVNAASYRIQLAADSLFSSLIVNDSTLTDSTRIISGLSNLTNYWWRVSAKNAGGISSYSNVFKFTTIIAAPLAPSLISPANNSVGNLTALTLVWNKSASAANYRVQLSSDSLFSTFIINDSTLADSTRVVSGLNPLTNYWWRVNAKNAGGISAYSTVYKFRTLGVPAQIAGIFIPANGAVNQPITIDFKWSKTFDQTLSKINNSPTKFNSLSILNYWYEITSDSVSLAGIIRDSLLTDTNKTQGGFNYSTSYYWRVKAKNQIGWGAFSFWQKFTTAEPPVASVTLKVIPAGFYNPLTGMLRMRDTLRVYLVDSATCLRVDSNKVVLDSITFSTSLSFTNAPTGNYYLYVYHRNHLPIASRLMQSVIRGSSVSYDLTTDSAKVFGFNAVRVSFSPERWGMIPGDANSDEFVDGLDQPIWMNQNGLTGYLQADFNGDGFVDGLDQTIWILNNGLSSYLPCITPYLDLGFEKLRIIFEKGNYLHKKENKINNN